MPKDAQLDAAAPLPCSGLTRPRDGITLILGDQGTGKSYLFKQLVWANVLPYPMIRAGWHLPIVVWDARTRWRSSPGIVALRTQDPEEWASYCFKIAPCVAATDEADEAFHSDEGGPRKGSALNELVRYARNPKFERPHFRAGPVPLIAVARRPLDLHKRLRSSVNVVLTGRISDEADREVMRRSMGLPSELVDQLATLPDRSFLRYDRGG